MRPEDIIQKARDKAELEHFDSDSFREGLARVANAVNARRNRTPRSIAWFEESAVTFLSNRLKIADYIRRHPDVLARPVEAPIIILGLPRTGSSLLSSLLSTDTSLRSLLRWEANDPVPPPTQDGLNSDPRYLALAQEDREAAANPLAKMHYEPWNGPTECHTILSHDFKSAGLEPGSVSMDYGIWILQCDTTSTYEYHRSVLQVLQSHTSGTWNLKLPSHALNIRTLMTIYPDAKIIWTHRDPLQVSASFMSMMAAAQALHLQEIDYDYITRYYPQRLREHVARPMAVQDESPADPFFHMFYGALMRDPLAQMQKLYAWLGRPFTDNVEQGIRGWLAENPQGKFGKHDYDLGRFGMTPDQLRPFFQDYMDRFDIESEAGA